MRKTKARLTVTVDRTLVKAGAEAVRAGRAASLSGWVNQALAERAAKESRLQAGREAVAAYEARFGKITQEEMDEQERKDRAAAIRPNAKGHGRRRHRGAA